MAVVAGATSHFTRLTGQLLPELFTRTLFYCNSCPAGCPQSSLVGGCALPTVEYFRSLVKVLGLGDCAARSSGVTFHCGSWVGIRRDLGTAKVSTSVLRFESKGIDSEFVSLQESSDDWLYQEVLE